MRCCSGRPVDDVLGHPGQRVRSRVANHWPQPFDAVHESRKVPQRAIGVLASQGSGRCSQCGIEGLSCPVRERKAFENSSEIVQRRELHLKCPDVTRKALWPRHSPLVRRERIAVRVGAICERHGVDGRAAGQQRMRLRRSAVVLERSEERVRARDISCAAKTAAAVTVEVVAEGSAAGGARRRCRTRCG